MGLSSMLPEWHKSLEKNIGRNFEREACHRVENSVKLTLNKAFIGLELLQELYLQTDLGVERSNAHAEQLSSLDIACHGSRLLRGVSA
jgi:hypothetical protein